MDRLKKSEIGEIWQFLSRQGKIFSYFPIGEKFKAPLIEIDTNELTDLRNSFYARQFSMAASDSEILQQVQDTYKSWGKFGPYGDLIQITIMKKGCYRIDFIGQLAFPKPALAADLVPLIRDKARNLYFVGITRKQEPCIGKPALIGGHLDIKGYHLETAAEALVHEAKDEAGIKIRVMKQFAHTLKNKPYMSRFPISVGLKNYPKLPSELLLIGTFNTSSEDKLPHLGVKRVYQTTAYTLIVDIYDQAFTPDEIAELFTAGDDAASIYIHKITSLQSPPFAIKHHRTIYRATLAKLLKEQRINIK